MILRDSRLTKLLLAVIFFTQSLAVKADEGMWIPLLLKQLNEADMQAKGLKLTAEDIFSINKTSLKDAVVQFGNGCTGEVISSEGLILTNHHCGYGQIQSHSSVENDYLTKGFWAMQRSEEKPNPGLTVTFIISMENITAEILNGVYDTMRYRKQIITDKIREIEMNRSKDGYKAIVRSFFNDNEYYLFITEVFRDVRLVGAPPSSIGKFGSDADNWMWPRHTGDFCLFRIYANKDNKPADFSPDNVPYKPRYHFPIALKDLIENDFTMVYGFPGRTTQYLPSVAVETIRKETDPVRVSIRDLRLEALDKEMRQNDTVRIKYAAKYASVSNAWKKWIGEMRGIDRTGIIDRKKEDEKKFIQLAGQSGNSQYQSILNRFDETYSKYRPLSMQRDYYVEAFLGIELFSLGNTINTYYNKAMDKAIPDADKDKEMERMKTVLQGFYKNFHKATDKKVCKALLPVYATQLPTDQRNKQLPLLSSKFKGDYSQLIDFIYSKSILHDEQKMMAELSAIRQGKSKIMNDPAMKIVAEAGNYFNKDIRPEFTRLENEISDLQRTYMKGQMELFKDKKFYPDANFTLRVTYGKISSYKPYDATRYFAFTTLEGIMEKEDPEVDEFNVDSKLKDLYKRKDYGEYATKDGTMRVCFIASNHTTGGNSGSPVLNDKGHLIGINFDRNWEGTMSDIVYSPSLVRNIVCDAHYILFIIDKFAGARHLVDEMTIVRD
jgi:hypothetical protein